MYVLKNITKKFDRQTVVENISFTVTPGEILGLLAPVAAGKTTIIRLAVTIFRAEQGEIIYNQKIVKNLSNKVFGYIPQLRGVYQRAKVIKYLVYSGILNQLTRAQARDAAQRYLRQYDLAELADKRIGDLNFELQERLLIIGSLLHEPEMLIVDEPFVGFSSRNESMLQTILMEFKQNNKMVILATRWLDRAENLCDRVCFLNDGKLILNMTVAEIRAQVKDNIFYLETTDDLSFLKLVKEIQLKAEDKDRYKISIKDKSFDVRKLIYVLNKKIKIIKFEQYQPGLLYIYTRLVKNLQRSKK
jgi:ABC-2 type transport system ATP-binding protein